MSFAVLKHMRDQFKVNVLAVEYPGYGLLQGMLSSEEAVYEVALTAFRFLVDEIGVRYSQIILFGRSLGSGPAVYLAAQYPVGGLILVSAFSSIRAAVQSIAGRVLAWTFKERFPNGRIIANVSCSTLFIHGGNDGLIPADHSLRLFRRCRARKLLITPPKMEHNSNLFGDASFLAVPAIHFFGFPGYYTTSPPRLPACLFENPDRRRRSRPSEAKASSLKPWLCDCLGKTDSMHVDVAFCRSEQAAEATGIPDEATSGFGPASETSRGNGGAATTTGPSGPKAAPGGLWGAECSEENDEDEDACSQDSDECPEAFQRPRTTGITNATAERGTTEAQGYGPPARQTLRPCSPPTGDHQPSNHSEAAGSPSQESDLVDEGPDMTHQALNDQIVALAKARARLEATVKAQADNKYAVESESEGEDLDIIVAAAINGTLVDHTVGGSSSSRASFPLAMKPRESTEGSNTIFDVDTNSPAPHPQHGHHHHHHHQAVPPDEAAKAAVAAAEAVGAIAKAEGETQGAESSDSGGTTSGADLAGGPRIHDLSSASAAAAAGLQMVEPEDTPTNDQSAALPTAADLAHGGAAPDGSSVMCGSKESRTDSHNYSQGPSVFATTAAAAEAASIAAAAVDALVEAEKQLGQARMLMPGWPAKMVSPRMANDESGAHSRSSAAGAATVAVDCVESEDEVEDVAESVGKGLPSCPESQLPDKDREFEYGLSVTNRELVEEGI